MSDDENSRTRFREPVAVEPAAARTDVMAGVTAGVTADVTADVTAKPTTRTPPAKQPDPPAADNDADAADEGRGTPRRSGSTTLAVTATALAVALLAATIVFAVLYASSRDDGDTLAQTRRTVLSTAQQTAVDFSSYDYRHLDQDFAQVSAKLTPAFRKSYRSTAAALKATLSQYKAVGTAKVLDAGVASLSGDKATVILFLDQTVTGTTSKTPSVERNRLRVKLQRTGGSWLVSALDVR